MANKIEAQSDKSKKEYVLEAYTREQLIKFLEEYKKLDADYSKYAADYRNAVGCVAWPIRILLSLVGEKGMSQKLNESEKTEMFLLLESIKDNGQWYRLNATQQLEIRKKLTTMHERYTLHGLK